MRSVQRVRQWDRATAETIGAVREACRDGDGHDPLDEAADLRLRHHGLEGAALWLAGAAGFALVHEGALELAVAPAQRGHGCGTALAAAVVDGVHSAWSHGDHPAARRLAERHGFRAARELWVMRRSLDGPLPGAGDPRVRPLSPGDEAELLRVNAAAFADHPEQGAMDEANLAERMAEPWFDPAGLLVAAEDDRLLGFHWTKVHPSGEGEVYVVGVDPAAQGQGLGKVLTLAGLNHLHDRLGDGAQVLLYVESDNLPARALYEALGFGHDSADTHTQYLRGG